MTEAEAESKCHPETVISITEEMTEPRSAMNDVDFKISDLFPELNIISNSSQTRNVGKCILN